MTRIQLLMTVVIHVTFILIVDSAEPSEPGSGKGKEKYGGLTQRAWKAARKLENAKKKGPMDIAEAAWPEAEKQGIYMSVFSNKSGVSYQTLFGRINRKRKKEEIAN